METGCGEAEGPLLVADTLRALGNALCGDGAPPAVWFKESSQKNLRSRDFLVPRGALRKTFPGGGEVPEEILQKLRALDVGGVFPVKSCQQTDAGLLIRLDRPATFRRILKDFTPYLTPVAPSPDIACPTYILNCAPLHSLTCVGTLKLTHLRALLLADHLAELLRLKGNRVHLIPPIRSKEVGEFLRQLRVSWPSSEESPCIEEIVSRYRDSCSDCAGSARLDRCPADEVPSQTGLFSLHLRSWAEGRGLCLKHYDPNIDYFMVSEEDLSHVAHLQHSVQESLKEAASCAVLHVVGCEEEFHQQKLDLLWRLLDPGASAVTQKHLICGPVKVLALASPVSCSQYAQLRKSQMREASVMKYGDSVRGESWEEIINSLTSSAIKFELMATPHRTQVTLNLEDTNITTKGTKSGAFVMYNCARLATMFDSYHSAARQGFYPEFPPAEQIKYSGLNEEGEWLLLFNYIMTFPELLSQASQISLESPGLRVTVSTESVCKFLVSLSMDFSCYYNRVHILGEPLPHLYDQMFARLQLMKAVRSVLHAALATLHIEPLAQI